MDERTYAAYLSDLDYFQSRLEATSDPAIYYHIALICNRINMYEEAISACVAGSKHFNKYYQLQTIHAEALMNSGRKDEALEFLYDVIMSDEDNFKALKLLGLIYKNENDDVNAIKYLRAAYLKAPEGMDLFAWLDELGGFPLPSIYDQPKETQGHGFAGSGHDDLYNFNIEGVIEDAKAVITDLIEEMAQYKEAGKTIYDMLADKADAGEETAPVPAAADSLMGGSLSDDEILNALNKNKAAKENDVPPPVGDPSIMAPEAPDVPEDTDVGGNVSDEEVDKTDALLNDFQMVMDNMTRTLDELSSPSVDEVQTEMQGYQETVNIQNTASDVSDIAVSEALQYEKVEPGDLSVFELSLETAMEHAAQDLDNALSFDVPAGKDKLSDILAQEATIEKELADIFDIMSKDTTGNERIDAGNPPQQAADFGKLLADGGNEMAQLPDDVIKAGEVALEDALNISGTDRSGADVNKDILEPFIPDDLVNEVFEEAGVESDTDYTDDEEKIDSSIVEKVIDLDGREC